MADKLVVDEKQSNLRDHLVQNAVKFLQNPQVTGSPMEHKKAFLLKKGLTNEEIDEAVSRANVPQQAVAPVYIQPPPQSFWQKGKDSLAGFVIFGGVAFAIYQFYKAFLKRKLFGKDEHEVRLELVEASVSELKRSMEETLREMSSDNLELMKSDITSIKGILLSKDKFAAVPKTTPILPQWQLAADEKSEKQREEAKGEDVPDIESNEETPKDQED
ncbi:DgyrCDS7831 [Dimorphilus gyrociliatus]|uniref:Peroxisomal membrane protein PEX14 n=1 Tax=Dimorphilus gyrociliatus TaxID=2664684 RepID=A0A7I8VU08_9ANNE|nr:DgyrCDS7831 [Dimorphilus gyrociliatus]